MPPLRTHPSARGKKQLFTLLWMCWKQLYCLRNCDSYSFPSWCWPKGKWKGHSNVTESWENWFSELFAAASIRFNRKAKKWLIERAARWEACKWKLGPKTTHSIDRVAPKNTYNVGRLFREKQNEQSCNYELGFVSCWASWEWGLSTNACYLRYLA